MGVRRAALASSGSVGRAKVQLAGLCYLRLWLAAHHRQPSSSFSRPLDRGTRSPCEVLGTCHIDVTFHSCTYLEPPCFHICPGHRGGISLRHACSSHRAHRCPFDSCLLRHICDWLLLSSKAQASLGVHQLLSVMWARSSSHGL